MKGAFWLAHARRRTKDISMYQVSKILAKYSDFSLNSVFASK